MNKQQLELLPYASRKFDKFNPKKIKEVFPYVDTLLEEIVSVDRKYVFYQLRHYEGSHLLLSVCGRKLIQQTLIIKELGEKVEMRICSTPTTKAANIYSMLNYKPMPFRKIKICRTQ